jgi:hypothetical protein
VAVVEAIGTPTELTSTVSFPTESRQVKGNPKSEILGQQHIKPHAVRVDVPFRQERNSQRGASNIHNKLAKHVQVMSQIILRAV